MSAETFTMPSGMEPEVALRHEHIRLHRDIEAYRATVSDIEENINQPDFNEDEKDLVMDSRVYFENRLHKGEERLRQIGCLSLELCSL